MIIDFHAHLPYDKVTNQFDFNALLSDMADNGIDQRVTSALYGPSIIVQNDIVATLVKKYPDRIIGCAIINPKSHECLSELERIIAMKCFSVIELDPLEHNYFPEECEALDDIISRASQASLIIAINTGWGCKTMPYQWEKYALKHPDAIFVMLHMGTTDFGYGTINYLAPRLENMYLETSCMYELPILRKAFRTLEQKKLIFGSHYPHKFTQCSIDAFALLKLSDLTKKKLFYENAHHLLVEKSKI